MNTLRFTTALIQILISFSLTSCATLPSSEAEQSIVLTSSGDVLIQIEKSRGILINNVKLEEREGLPVISGRINTSGHRTYFGGYIALVVENNAGVVVEKIHSTVTSHFSHRHHRANQHVFRFHLTQPLPSGAKIVVSHQAK